MMRSLYRSCMSAGLGLLIGLMQARAQLRDGTTAPLPTTPNRGSPASDPGWIRWRDGNSVSLSFAQSYVANTPAGDEHSLSMKLGAYSCEEYPLFDAMKLKNMLMVKLGASYVSDSLELDPIRAGENEIFNETLIALPLGWRVDPYIAANVRTAVTETFRYSKGTRTRVANLWDPVISQQSMGLAWMTSGSWGIVSTRIGVALQQIRAREHTMLTDDWKTKGVIEAYRAGSAIELVSDAYLQIDSSARYTGRFGMLGSIQEPDVWTVRFENQLRFRLWRFIGVDLICNVFYDPKQSLRTQIRQSLTLGLIYDF